MERGNRHEKRVFEEMRAALAWQFQAGSKYFRPLTMWSCYRAVYQGEIPPDVIRSAVVLEMFHNVSLIIDDIAPQLLACAPRGGS